MHARSPIVRTVPLTRKGEGAIDAFLGFLVQAEKRVTHRAIRVGTRNLLERTRRFRRREPSLVLAPKRCEVAQRHRDEGGDVMESKGDVRGFGERAPFDEIEVPPGACRECEGRCKPR
jgi:hypothetical protein